MTKSYDKGVTQFWLRKLHSISGTLSAGLFLTFHFAEPGSDIFAGSFVSLLILFSLPLFFHAAYGLYIVYEGRIEPYAHFRNWMYILQRITALIIFVSLPLHVYVMEVKPQWLELEVIKIFWIAGTLAAAYHLANGLFGFLVHWGIAVGKKTQRVAVILSIMAFAALVALSAKAYIALA